MRASLRKLRPLVLLAIMASVQAVYAVTGCASVAKTIDDVNDPSDDLELKKCRNEGRAARDAGADGSAAVEVYIACTRDGGLR